jgi:hypothetical protein
MKKIILLVLICVLCIGCSPALITASKWKTDNGPNVQTRCVWMDMRNQKEMDQVFTKFDGWKLIYISEYTTEHKMGTDAAVCFERAIEPKAK